MAQEKIIGKVTHYYDKLGVAIIKLSDELHVGQTIHIKRTNDGFTQKVEQMQYEHAPITSGAAMQEVGVKVEQKAHENDLVLLVTDETPAAT